jgi:hypothetical protein
VTEKTIKSTISGEEASDDMLLSASPNLSYLITSSFWKRLTRRIDHLGVTSIFKDTKDGSDTNNMNRLYIPESDTRGWEYWNSIVGEGGLVSTIDENGLQTSFHIEH